MTGKARTLEFTELTREVASAPSCGQAAGPGRAAAGAKGKVPASRAARRRLPPSSPELE